jgi:hypothetical protein
VENGISRRFILCCGCCLLLGAGGGIGIGWGIWGRPAGGGAELDRQRDSLAGEYSERQRELESGLAECIGIIDNARATIERTDGELSGAIKNLEDAKRFVKAGIEERENLKMDIDSLRARLLDLRGDNRVEDNEVAE